MDDIAKLKEILRTEYGINNNEEFEAAVRKSSGINLGIFTMNFSEGSAGCEQKTEKRFIA